MIRTAALAAGMGLLMTAAAAQGAFSTIVENGHSDIGAAYHGGALEGHVHYGVDELEADEVLYRFLPAEMETRSASASWNFIGVPAGEKFWRGRPTNNVGRQYIGMSTEEVDFNIVTPTAPTDQRIIDVYGTDAGPYIYWKLTALNAPAGGVFSMFDGNSTPDPVWITTSDGIGADDVFAQQAGGHVHTNFAFSKAGFYDVTFEISAIIGGVVQTTEATFHFEAVDVPEPASLSLLGLGALALLRRRR